MRVYFFCTPVGEPESARYQHSALALAEGCRALGIEVSGNMDYWPLEAGGTAYAIPFHPEVRPSDADVVIVSEGFSLARFALPEAVTRASRPYATVFLCRQDGARLRSLEPQFRCFDLVLRSSFSRGVQYAPNFRPWAYGLTQRMIDAVQTAPVSRRAAIAVNHRPSLVPQSVRMAAVRRFLPKLSGLLEIDRRMEPIDQLPKGSSVAQLMWSQTGRRHNPDYYQRLASSVACSAFCGYFVPAWPRDKRHLASRFAQRVYSKAGGLSRSVIQWDSWRFWESLASGCATFQIDAEAYGCVFPEMPIKWETYVGIDFAHVDDSIARLREDPDLMIRIGEAGRAWALQRYAPAPTAERFLRLLFGELGMTAADFRADARA